MTILSKRKSSQGKNEELSENSAHHGGTHSHPPTLGAIPNHTQSSEPLGHVRLNPAQCWPSATDKQETHPPHYEGLESGSSKSKRRHQTSPRRRSRSTLRERAAPSPPVCSSVVAVGSPKPNCSTTIVEEAGKPEGNGYNSGDEHGPAGHFSTEEWLERDRNFEKTMQRRGYIIKPMEEDGACLFRAIADQVYGDQDMHSVVRKHCMDYIAANEDYYSHYVTEDFQLYIIRKRLETTHGNHIEIQAMCEMYNRTVEVYSYGSEPINIFQGKHKNDNEPIRLSYQHGSHYNSIVDPYKATIGVGLGLPSFTPGLADKNLMNKAVTQSETSLIEQTMLEDKLRATDWEATNEAIEEQVARESYLQWLLDTEKRNKTFERSSATSSSSTVTSTEARSSPRTRSGGYNSPSQAESHRSSPKLNEDHRKSPKADSRRYSPKDEHRNSPKVTKGFEEAIACSSTTVTDPGKKETEPGFQLYETASFLNIAVPEMFGLAEWEDEAILAQVLASSLEQHLTQQRK